MSKFYFLLRQKDSLLILFIQGGHQFWALTPAGEVRRDEACLDHDGGPGPPVPPLRPLFPFLSRLLFRGFCPIFHSLVLQNYGEVIIFLDQVPFPCHGQGGNQFWRLAPDFLCPRKNIILLKCGQCWWLKVPTMFKCGLSLRQRQSQCNFISLHFQPDGRSMAKEGK